MSHHHHEDHDHSHDGTAHAEGGAHASVGFYSFIAVLLCLVTGIEVLMLYPPLNQISDWVRVILLVVLSLAKFATVVAFFMHLYFDHPLTTALFLTGMILAAGTMVGLIHIMPGPHEPRLQPKGKPKMEESEGEKHSRAPVRYDVTAWQALTRA